MKTQNGLKNLVKTFDKFKKEHDTLLNLINKSYLIDLVKYQEDLLLKISTEYNLDYEELHKKYIKNFKKSMKKNKLLIDEDSDSETNNIKSVSEDLNTSNVLQKKIIDGNEYYIENKEGGTIYNKEVIKIGEVQNGEYLLYE